MFALIKVTTFSLINSNKPKRKTEDRVFCEPRQSLTAEKENWNIITCKDTNMNGLMAVFLSCFGE